jgi:hypothetical protein
MPTNKREEMVFTVLMCFTMVLVMTIYNEIRIFGFSDGVIAKSWLGFPLAYIVGMFLDWFIVSKFAHFMLHKLVKPGDKPIKFILTISISMVVGMVTFMSLFGAILAVGLSPLTFKVWMINIPYNFVVALPLQLLIAGPLVRFLFNKIFPSDFVGAKEMA